MVNENQLIRIDLFFSNYEILSKIFKSKNSFINYACAMYLSVNYENVSDRILSIKYELEDVTSSFSSFRTQVMPAILTILSLKDEPDEVLEEALKMYTMLKKHFNDSMYLPFVALEMTNISHEELEDVVKRTKELYQKMKDKYPFITGNEDINPCLLLTLTGNSVDESFERYERFYNKLDDFGDDLNGRQALAMVLSLNTEFDETLLLERVKSLYLKLCDKNLLFSKYVMFPLIGGLAFSTKDIDTIVNDIYDTSVCLDSRFKYNRKYRKFKKSLNFYSAFLNLNNCENGVCLLSNAMVNQIVIAQVMVLTCCVLYV